MTTETLDKLYLEIGLKTTARTWREVHALDVLKRVWLKLNCGIDNEPDSAIAEAAWDCICNDMGDEAAIAWSYTEVPNDDDLSCFYMKKKLKSDTPLEGTAGNYDGNDNYGRPKADYLKKIVDMDDDALESECYSMIYKSARRASNPRADWHWKVDACYDESKKRGGKIYSRAYKKCYADHAG